jgi:hypothetical protein
VACVGLGWLGLVFAHLIKGILNLGSFLGRLLAQCLLLDKIKMEHTSLTTVFGLLLWFALDIYESQMHGVSLRVFPV